MRDTRYFRRKARMPKCTFNGCERKELAHGFCPSHLYRFKRYGNPAHGKTPSTGRGDGAGYILISTRDGRHERLHRILAERALGKPLPPKAVVHHHNLTKANEGDGTLVICPNESYHQLLHRRQRAFDACGNAGWRKCVFCKQYSPPEEMYVNPANSAAFHRECSRRYAAARRRGAPAEA